MTALTLLLLTQLQPLPDTLVPFDSKEGHELLQSAQHKADFFPLVSHFTTQRTTAFCGVAASVMVLDSLDVQSPAVKDWAPFRAFTQENVFEAKTPAGIDAEHVSKGGLTVEQLSALLEANGASAAPVFADASTADAFRAELKKNLDDPKDFIVVDFNRSELKQDMGAHWSPVAAYDEGSDRVLVLDVARMRYPPYWAKVDDLFRAMNTSDIDSGKSRGWVVVTKASGAIGKQTVGPMGHQLMKKVAMAGSGLFLLGAFFGFLVTWLRMRKKA
jgi:hypothetical protein